MGRDDEGEVLRLKEKLRIATEALEKIDSNDRLDSYYAADALDRMDMVEEE